MSESHAAAHIDQLVQRFYEELKQIARKQRRQDQSVTSSTTMLVHELYLRMAGQPGLHFEKPIQFYAYAAQAMRHLLVDRARQKGRIKAGGEWLRVEFDAASDEALPQLSVEALALDAALAKLELVDPRAAQLVELHFFGGQSFEQIADLMETSRRTVFRDWEFARAYLLRELRS